MYHAIAEMAYSNMFVSLFAHVNILRQVNIIDSKYNENLKYIMLIIYIMIYLDVIH